MKLLFYFGKQTLVASQEVKVTSQSNQPSNQPDGNVAFEALQKVLKTPKLESA